MGAGGGGGGAAGPAAVPRIGKMRRDAASVTVDLGAAGGATLQQTRAHERKND
jgi:hypothetical protein